MLDHLFRRRAGQMVAALTRKLGAAHVDLAEDAVQDALVRALKLWPFAGVPDDPAAWLYRVALNRALDLLRRDTSLGHKEPEIRHWLSTFTSGAPSDAGVADDELSLVFACCHPAIPRESGVALALKTVGGLSANEIARAFVIDESAVAQRIVRAKRRLRQADIAVAIPDHPAELLERLPAVLDTIYLIFNEGYSATTGDALLRHDLCGEALRLAVLVADHPSTGLPAAHALAALLFFHGARLAARAGLGGDPVLLADQDRARWDQSLIDLGFRHLSRAGSGDVLTRYHIEAQIASLHAAAARFDDTDWPAVLDAYDILIQITPSPIAAVHRAVALGMVRGPAAALAELARLAGDDALARYVWFYTTRGYWHAESGDRARAAADYAHALTLDAAEPVHRFVATRLRDLTSRSP